MALDTKANRTCADTRTHNEGWEGMKSEPQHKRNGKTQQRQKTSREKHTTSMQKNRKKRGGKEERKRKREPNPGMQKEQTKQSTTSQKAITTAVRQLKPDSPWEEQTHLSLGQGGREVGRAGRKRREKEKGKETKGGGSHRGEAERCTQLYARSLGHTRTRKEGVVPSHNEVQINTSSFSL